MSCCGIDTVNGEASGGGGGEPVTYQCVYIVDWRDAFAQLGPVDLNTPGATLTYQGVTWTTPNVANSGVDQISATTSWGLTANGLEIVGVNGSNVAGNNPTFPHIFANLAAIGANTSTPFDADPTLRYRLQAFVPDGNGNVNFEESGIGLYKPNGVPAGGYSSTFVTHGFNAGVAGIPSASAGNTSSPARLSRPDLVPAGTVSYRIPTILYASSGKTIDCYSAPYDSAAPFAWPSNAELRFIGGYAEPTELDNDTPGDPFQGWRVCLGHAGGVASGYNATIQRLRICQF
jgi:hypothetical protein